MFIPLHYQVETLKQIDALLLAIVDSPCQLAREILRARRQQLVFAYCDFLEAVNISSHIGVNRMNVAVSLTEAGTAKFETWFASVAHDGVMCGAAEAELCDIMADRLIAAETLVYELAAQYTLSGRPESITLTHADLDIREFPDGDADLGELNHHQLLTRCRGQIAAGQRIEAVRNYRAATGASLAEAHRVLSQ